MQARSLQAGCAADRRAGLQPVDPDPQVRAGDSANTAKTPEQALAGLRKDPAGFAEELPLAAAAKWYELRLVSQERAAQIAELSRRDFLDALGRLGVTPFQYDADEIIREAEGG